MSDKNNGAQSPGKEDDNLKNINYPASEDIYNRLFKEEDINPEDISKVKEPNAEDLSGTGNEKDFNQAVSLSDLDIPGAELDDEQEDIGNEDEENNYYSLGGDNHNDLEEDKGG